MWVGSSERNLHAIFEQARSHRPCVLFFDEVDALAASRSDMRHSGARHLINQFLSELDGITSNNDGVLILAGAAGLAWRVLSTPPKPETPTVHRNSPPLPDPAPPMPPPDPVIPVIPAATMVTLSEPDDLSTLLPPIGNESSAAYTTGVAARVVRM